MCLKSEGSLEGVFRCPSSSYFLCYLVLYGCIYLYLHNLHLRRRSNENEAPFWETSINIDIVAWRPNINVQIIHVHLAFAQQDRLFSISISILINLILYLYNMLMLNIDTTMEYINEVSAKEQVAESRKRRVDERYISFEMTSFAVRSFLYLYRRKETVGV